MQFTSTKISFHYLTCFRTALYSKQIKYADKDKHCINSITVKMAFFHNMEKLCNLAGVLWRERGKSNNQNITIMLTLRA